MEAPIDPPGVLALVFAVFTFYLMIPAGVPFFTPVGSFFDVIRALNFSVGVLVTIVLYLNDFTLLESVFVGAFWTFFASYLFMT
ncbi:MAG: hypothetical protein ACR2Q4_04755 [Geminicoccaceae bacterium]